MKLELEFRFNLSWGLDYGKWSNQHGNGYFLSVHLGVVRFDFITG